MVVYEAARAIVNLKNVQSKDLSPAVSGVYCANVTLFAKNDNFVT